MKKIYVLMLAVLLVCSLGYAKKFSDAPAGQGASTVGSGGDYATLADAANDFNSLAGGCTGNWTLTVISDLTEAANVGFGNSTNGYTVTLQSDGVAIRTITFTAATVHATYRGHLVIGVKDLTGTPVIQKTDKFVIDGGATKQLTLINSSASIASSAIIIYYGDCDGGQVKNCAITNLSTNAGANSCTGIDFIAAGTFLIPNDYRVEGCAITALTGNVASGIQASGTGTAGLAQTGAVITGNTISAKRYGIYLALNAGGEISNNEIKIQNGTASTLCIGIYHSSCNAVFGWTMDITKNKFTEMTSLNNADGDYGLVGMWLAASATNPTANPIYNVNNNMIANFSFPSNSALRNQTYKGIIMSAENTIFNVYNNSIDMVEQPLLNAVTLGRTFAIGAVSATVGSQVTNIKNNMIRYGVATGANAYAFYSATTTGINSDFNNIYIYSTATQFAYVGTTACADLTAWQTLSATFGPTQDVHSSVIDPSGLWVSASDLHISGAAPYNVALSAPAVAGVSTDIDGEARFGKTYMGCDEKAASAIGPTLYMPDTTVDFGKILPISLGGSAVQMNVQVWNISTSALNISGATPGAGSGDFSVISFPPSIAANESGVIVVQYTPNTLGPQSQTFSIASNDPASPMVLTVNGTAGTKKFSDPPVGQGMSTVGTGGDYATLAAAANDYNSVAGGCTGNWTLTVISNLTEPANVGFGNFTNGYTVTLKSDGLAMRTITFTAATVNATYRGHLVVGVKNLAATPAIQYTDRFVIDGGIAKQLTLINTSAAIANSAILIYYGNSDYGQVKNTVITNLSTNAAANGCTGIDFIGAGTTLVPDFYRVEGCAITTLTGTLAAGIQSTGTATAPNAQTGYVITNNVIISKRYCFYLALSGGGEISDNEIRIQNGHAGALSVAFYHYGCNSAFGWTMDIVRNRFVQLQTLNVTANQGIAAIWLNAPTVSQRSIYNITNNMICGWDYGAGAALNQVYKAIICGSENARFNIYQNSIDMPVQPRVNGVTINYAFAIGSTSVNFGSQVFDIKNNMIRFGTVTGTQAYAFYFTNPSGLTSDFNDIYFYNGTTKFGYLGAVACNTLAAWRTETARFGPAQDMHTVNTDPSPSWISATDLHINGAAVFNPAFCGPIIPGVAADIDGNPRNTVTYMGCDEFAATAAVPTVYLPSTNCDFGKKLMIGSGGLPIQKNFPVWNVSTAPLNIASVTPVVGNPDVIIISFPPTIAPNQSGDIVVQYTPNLPGLQNASFNIASNDPVSPALFTFTGTGNATKRFSDPPVGRGTSTVGSTADDYVTLMDAAQDFNNTAGGCTGNWNLLVNATWTEPYNVGFGNATNGFTVTMKPNTGLTPAITLDQRALTAAFPGHLVIGATNFGDANNAVKTDNFVIDGDNGAPLSKDMTIWNAAASIAASRLIVVHGDSDGVAIKNCILTNRSTSVAANGCTGVVFYSRNHTINGIIYNLIPENWIVDNNTITTNITAGSYGIGVEMNASGTITAGYAQSGWTINNNIIGARQRGIFMNQTAGGTVSNNTVSIGAVLTGLLGHGIWHLSCNATPGWTMNVFNNQVTSMSHAGPTATFGLTAIDLSGSAVTGAFPTYNVYNNMISGFTFVSATNGIYRGIHCGTTNCNLNVYYNSINLPANPLVISTPGYAYAIGISTTAQYSVNADIRNNNIRFAQNNMWGIWREDINGFTSNYNNIFIDGAAVGANFGRLAGYNFGTLALWQAGTGHDLNSTSNDPAAAIAPYTGAWTSATDLHFSAWPGPYYTSIPVAGITADIDANARSATAPTMGCDESQKTPAAGDQTCFVPGGALDFGKKVRIINGGMTIPGQMVVFNAGGTGTLNITGVSYVSGAAEFAVNDTFPKAILPGTYGVINFDYTPTIYGAVSAVFNILSDDAASPTAVNVIGRGSDSKKFSVMPAGRLRSKIGSSLDDDYPSLELAVYDFNNTAGGCTGNWTLLINTTPLDVNSVISFGNATNGFTVTMKPNTGMFYPVIINSNVTAMGTIPGHFIIGTNDNRNLANLVKVDNFIIDGSSDGSPTRQMTFQNTAAGIANSRMFVVYGDCDNVQFKNCTITNLSTNAADNGCTGIEYFSRNVATGVNAIPDNGLVQNCAITAQGTGALYGYGIRQTNSGTITTANAQTGMVFRNNDIAARYMGIWMGQTAGAIVEGNNIALVNTGTLSIRGIYFSTCNALYNWTMQINNNKITQLQNATGGMTGIDLGLNSANGSVTFDVYNNMISGFAFTGASSNKEYRGIYHASRSNEYHIVNIYYNSINMPALAGLTFTDDATGRPLCAGIQIAADTGSFSYSRTINVKNNIVRVEQNIGCALYLREYLASITNQNFNNVFVAGGAVYGRYQEGTTIINYATLAAWQAVHTALDKNTSTLDPAIVNGGAPFNGKWTSATDLLFDAYPAGGFTGTPVAGIATDINGDARHALAPVMGCDEKKITGAKFFARDYDFGYKEIIRAGGKGVIVSEILPIYNLGDSDLTVTDIYRASGSDELSVLGYTTTAIPAGGSGSMTVEYNPATLGARSAIFNAVSNDAYALVTTPTLALSGEAVYPQIEVTCSLGSDWGNVFLGATTTNKSIAIKNVGKVPLVISAITASGHPDIAPAALPPLPYTLDPAPGGNNTTYATYKYTAMTAGPVSKTVSINSDAEVSAEYYTFTGRGIGVSLAENPMFVGYAKVQGLDGAATITKNLVIVNETNFDTDYTITRISGTKFRTLSTVHVDAFSTAGVPVEYAATAVVNDAAVFNMVATHPQMPALTATVSGRGWTKTQGKLYMVNGNDGGTFQVDNGGTYTLTRIEIQPGAFVGVRELRIQEPTNLYGKDNAIELKMDPAIVLANNATLWVEYHPSDVPPTEQNINMGVTRYWGSWNVLSGTPGTFVDRGGGKFEVRYDTFTNLLSPFVYATGTGPTRVEDWKLIK